MASCDALIDVYEFLPALVAAYDQQEACERECAAQTQLAQEQVAEALDQCWVNALHRLAQLASDAPPSALEALLVKYLPQVVTSRLFQ